MKVFGLTGGIASGKSSVAKFFAQLGAPIVDADVLAREVVEVGSEGLAELVQYFGTEILQSDGSLDRKALGARMFSDDTARAAINRITHPRIAAAGQSALNDIAQTGAAVALYEAPLIVENNLHKTMDGLIVVSIPEALQLQRLQQRDAISEADATARLHAQFPLEKKLAFADYIIDNSRTLEDTKSQVKKIWAQLNSGELL